MSVREHGPGEPGRGVRHGLPGPRDAGGDGRGAGRALAAAGAPRRVGRGDRARGGGGGAGAGRRPPAGPPHRHALRRRAAARGDRRRAGAPPAAAAARRAHLAAGPGGRRRADLAAAPPERGVGHGGGDRRAPPRALPARGRPGDGDRGRRAWRATRRPRGFLDWAGRGGGALATPVARLFSWPAWGRCRCRSRRRARPARAGLAPRALGAEPAHARHWWPTRCCECATCGTRSRTGRRCCAASIWSLEAGRAGGADGPQRRRASPPCCACSRAWPSPPAGGSSARATWRCCCRTPATT